VSGALPLGALDLAGASVLVLVAGACSVALGLGLERALAIAAARTVAQLLIVGQILSVVFAWRSPLGVAAVAVVMVAAASQAAWQRPERKIAGGLAQTFVTLLVTGLLTSSIVTAFIVDVRPWYTPQYIIPLLGMVLGNTLTGLSLCTDSLLEAFSNQKARVESDLLAGATAWEAARGPMAEAVRRGMIPVLNAMSVVGIVSLPGMMTGQILAGADPARAVKYQIVVMFMLSAATALGSVAIALLIFRRVFDRHHRLQSELISPRSHLFGRPP